RCRHPDFPCHAVGHRPRALRRSLSKGNAMSLNAQQWQAPPKVPAGHFVSSKIYTDPEIFAEEQDKIMRRTWKFACHESEIPNTGDYRTFDWGGYPLFVIRGEDGKIRTFINSCSHRGATIL